MIGLEYFEPPSEGSKERKSFDKWYEEQKNKTYIFREAIYYYCRLDVDILRQGCIIFSRLIYKVTGVLPFYDRTCHTVAGLALKIYRGNYLEKNTIGQIPTNGYGGVKVNQSVIALCWLREIEKELCEKGFILDSRLSVKGEQKILDRYVDGYCEQTRTIYQFHGCFYHGCKKCYDGETYNDVLNEQFFILRSQTIRLTTLFRQAGYTVIEKWECDYKEESEITENYLKHIRFFFVHLDLHPRDALFGGRTSPTVLYYECRNGEKIMYNDVTSLYPFVQKTLDFPIQHPEIYRGDSCRHANVRDVFGLIKCKILPPTDLLFPVLLCATCVIERQQEQCTHDDNQRVLYGTWTSVEVQKAIQMGYKVLAVYEIYNFKHKGKIFDTYVNTFMKLNLNKRVVVCLSDV